MTETKILFTKKSIKEIPAKDMNQGSKGVELEVQTDFLMSQICSLDKAVGNPTDGPFKKISFVFKGDAEKAYYDALLDSKNQNFELSFDKEKVFLMVFGFGNFIDKTKPEVQVSPGDNKSMVVFFESKFAGIITLESKDSEDDKKDDKSPDVSIVRNYCKSNDIKNLTYDEENDKLIIEYKQDKPTKELSDLSGELSEIKEYLLKNVKLSGKKRTLAEADWETKDQTVKENKTNWTPWLIGGGVILIFLIVLLLLSD